MKSTTTVAAVGADFSASHQPDVCATQHTQTMLPPHLMLSRMKRFSVQLHYNDYSFTITNN